MTDLDAMDLFTETPATLRCPTCGRSYPTRRSLVGHWSPSPACEPEIAELFWARVDKSGECWLWQGNRRPNGYGRFLYRGRSHHAHRLAWVLSRGALPPGLMVCHRCDNPRCVRPDHLFVGTAQDNWHDAIAKGRAKFEGRGAPGERNGSARLSEADVRRIRTSDLSARALGRELGVNETTVARVRNGRSWRHV